MLKRPNVFLLTLMLFFLVCFAFMLHEVIFNPVVDLWNLFTNPAILEIGYAQLNYPSALMLMGLFLIGSYYYFFQGEFDIRRAGLWWVPLAVWVCAWWVMGFHTSLPFWFQPSMDWPWLHDPLAHFSEFMYTVLFMNAFARCWKETPPGYKVRLEIPRLLRYGWVKK